MPAFTEKSNSRHVKTKLTHANSAATDTGMPSATAVQPTHSQHEHQPPVQLYRDALYALFECFSLSELAVMMRVGELWLKAALTGKPRQLSCRIASESAFDGCFNSPLSRQLMVMPKPLPANLTLPLNRHLLCLAIRRMVLRPADLNVLGASHWMSLTELSCKLDISGLSMLPDPLVFPSHLTHLSLELRHSYERAELAVWAHLHRLLQSVNSASALRSLKVHMDGGEIQFSEPMPDDLFQPLLGLRALESFSFGMSTSANQPTLDAAHMEVLRQLPRLTRLKLRMSVSKETFDSFTQQPHQLKLNSVQLDVWGFMRASDYGEGWSRLPTLTQLMAEVNVSNPSFFASLTGLTDIGLKIEAEVHIDHFTAALSQCTRITDVQLV